MGSGPWTFYNPVKRYLMDGSIDLTNDTFMMSLFTGASNANDVTLTDVSELHDEVADGNGYTIGGALLTSVTWDVGAYPSEMRFDCDDKTWNAVGGDIADVQWAVIWRARAEAPSYLICFCALSEAGQFTVPDGNPLFVGISPEGVFELN
jgi:hypothetical protein